MDVLSGNYEGIGPSVQKADGRSREGFGFVPYRSGGRERSGDDGSRTVGEIGEKRASVHRLGERVEHGENAVARDECPWSGTGNRYGRLLGVGNRTGGYRIFVIEAFGVLRQSRKDGKVATGFCGVREIFHQERHRASRYRSGSGSGSRIEKETIGRRREFGRIEIRKIGRKRLRKSDGESRSAFECRGNERRICNRVRRNDGRRRRYRGRIQSVLLIGVDPCLVVSGTGSGKNGSGRIGRERIRNDGSGAREIAYGREYLVHGGVGRNSAREDEHPVFQKGSRFRSRRIGPVDVEIPSGHSGSRISELRAFGRRITHVIAVFESNRANGRRGSVIFRNRGRSFGEISINVRDSDFHGVRPGIHRKGGVRNGDFLFDVRRRVASRDSNVDSVDVDRVASGFGGYERNFGIVGADYRRGTDDLHVGRYGIFGYGKTPLAQGGFGVGYADEDEVLSVLKIRSGNDRSEGRVGNGDSGDDRSSRSAGGGRSGVNSVRPGLARLPIHGDVLVRADAYRGRARGIDGHFRRRCQLDADVHRRNFR